jgi:glycosyltransferase involved in cell wall biosynthesis
MADARSVKPRLLVLTSTLPRWENDSEPRFVLDLATALKERFEPVILAPMTKGAAPFERRNGVSIRRYRYALFQSWERLASPGAIMPNLRHRPWLYALVPGFFLAQLIAIVSLLKRERFDLVHCHWLIPQGFVLALASLFVTVPTTLVTCHGADAFTLDSAPFRRLKKWILAKFDAVSVVSREITAKLIETSGRELSRPPVHIPMGVDVGRFSAPPIGDRTTPVILCAGRLAAKKGVDNLIAAIADPRIRARGIKLRVVGDGPLLGDLIKLTAEFRIQDRVHFAGPLSHDQLAQEMRSATLFCAPFVIAADGDREGTPTVILEAAASALPIIASDVGGCGEVVVNGKSGWLVPPGDVGPLVDAIEDALDHPDQARRYANAACAQSQSYSWTAIAERHAAILDELLTSSGWEFRNAA